MIGVSTERRFQVIIGSELIAFFHILVILLWDVVSYKFPLTLEKMIFSSKGYKLSSNIFRILRLVFAQWAGVEKQFNSEILNRFFKNKNKEIYFITCLSISFHLPKSGGTVAKNLPANTGHIRDTSSIPVRKIPWSRKW